METETQTQEVTEGAETVTEPTETAAPAEGAAEGTEAASTEPPKTRKERGAAAQGAWRAARENQRRAELAEANSRRLQETLDKLNSNVERIAPKAPGVTDTAKAKALLAAQRINPQDPRSIEEFLEASAEYGGAKTQGEIKTLQDALAELKNAVPEQRAPAVQRLIREFDWLSEDPELEEEVVVETRRAARRRNVNLVDASPDVRYKLMREGAIAVAQANNLPIPGANGRDNTASQRFGGMGGGRTGGGGGGIPQVSSEDRARIVDATSNMGGDYREADGRMKAPDQRVAIFMKRHGAQFQR